MNDLAPEVRGYIRQAEALEAVARAPAGGQFTTFARAHTTPLAALLESLKAASPRVAPFTLSAGLVPPGAAIVDASIQGYCGIPYRTPDGVIPGCPGLTRGLHGCPPHAPNPDETRSLLGQATALVLLQFEGHEGSAPQGEVHHFMLTAAKTLAKSGYDVLETYASGPCRVCKNGCGTTADCRLPDRRLFAFEACGFWVNSLVAAASPYPVLNGGPQPVDWIVDWRLPTQNTDAIRYNTGVLLR
jgi:hypothetical protein